jgi:hypothetical protein
MCDHHCLLSCYGASIYLQVGCLEMPALPDPPMLWEDKKKKKQVSVLATLTCKWLLSKQFFIP